MQARTWTVTGPWGSVPGSPIPGNHVMVKDEPDAEAGDRMFQQLVIRFSM